MSGKWKCPICGTETIGYGVKSHQNKHLRDKQYLDEIEQHNQKIKLDWNYDFLLIRDSFLSNFPKIETRIIYQAFKEDILKFISELPIDDHKKIYYVEKALNHRDCFSNNCIKHLLNDLPEIIRPSYSRANWDDRVEFFNKYSI